MQVDLDTSSIIIKTKEELWELLNTINYTPQLGYDGAIAQVQKRTEFITPSSLYWDLTELIIDKYFENCIGFRSVNPDLRTRFAKIAEFFHKKHMEVENTYASMKRQEKEDADKESGT